MVFRRGSTTCWGPVLPGIAELLLCGDPHWGSRIRSWNSARTREEFWGTIGSWSIFLKDFQYLEIDFLVLRVVCGSSMFFSLIYFLGGGWKLMFHITFRLTLLQRSLGPQKEFLLWACNMTGWWFGTCFIFPYIGNNNPNWLFFFQKSGYTANQMTSHVLREPRLLRGGPRIGQNSCFCWRCSKSGWATSQPPSGNLT